MQQAMLGTCPQRPLEPLRPARVALSQHPQHPSQGLLVPARPKLRSTAWKPVPVIRVAVQQAPVSQHSLNGAAPKEVPVKFTLRREVNNGQSHVVVGNHPALGAWKVEDAPHMTWNDGHVWSTEVLLPPGTTLEFKCVRVTHGEPDVEWESGYNHALAVPEAGVATITADVAWGTHVDVTAEPLVHEEEAPEPARVNGMAHSVNGAGPALDGNGQPFRKAAASLERQIAAVDYANGDGAHPEALSLRDALVRERSRVTQLEQELRAAREEAAAAVRASTRFAKAAAAGQMLQPAAPAAAAGAAGGGGASEEVARLMEELRGMATAMTRKSMVTAADRKRLLDKVLETERALQGGSRQTAAARFDLSPSRASPSRQAQVRGEVASTREGLSELNFAMEALRGDVAQAKGAVAELRGLVGAIMNKSVLSGHDKSRLRSQVAEAGRVLGAQSGGELAQASEAVAELQGLVNAMMHKSVVSGPEKKRLLDKVNEADKALDSNGQY